MSDNWIIITIDETEDDAGTWVYGASQGVLVKVSGPFDDVTSARAWMHRAQRCCALDCLAAADYLIETVRQTVDGMRMAGPDPWVDNTYACSDHVQDLLGYQPDARDPQDIRWLITPLGAIS